MLRGPASATVDKCYGLLILKTSLISRLTFMDIRWNAKRLPPPTDIQMMSLFIGHTNYLSPQKVKLFIFKSVLSSIIHHMVFLRVWSIDAVTKGGPLWILADVWMCKILIKKIFMRSGTAIRNMQVPGKWTPQKCAVKMNICCTILKYMNLIILLCIFICILFCSIYHVLYFWPILFSCAPVSLLMCRWLPFSSYLTLTSLYIYIFFFNSD